VPPRASATSVFAWTRDAIRRPQETPSGPDDAEVAVLVVAAREDLEIARQTRQVLS